MPLFELLKHAEEVGLGGMSENDLRELLLELRIRDVENINDLEKYKTFYEIDKKLKELIRIVEKNLDEKTVPTYEEWVLEQDSEEYKELKEELMAFQLMI